MAVASDIQHLKLSFSAHASAALGWGRCAKVPLLSHLLKFLEAGFDAQAAQLEPGRAPRLPDPWNLSLADSGGWCMAAVSADAGVRLGVDLERRRPRETRSLEAHLGWLERSDDLKHFYRRWTLAEACFKALGGAADGPLSAAALFAGLEFAARSPTRTEQRSGAGEEQGAGGVAIQVQGQSVWVQWQQPLPDFQSCLVALLPSNAAALP